VASIDKNGKLIYDKITQPSVVQANYLASMQDKYIVDDGISIYTGLMPWNWGTPPCSHTEIGFFVDGELWFFSSTSRKELGTTGKNGPRWRKASDLLHNYDRWLLQTKALGKIYDIGTGKGYILPGCRFKIEDKINRANSLIGLRYDMRGVFTDFIIPWAIFHGTVPTDVQIAKLKKIYCSKAVHYVDTGKLAVYSPKRRYEWAKDNRYVTVDDTEVFLTLRG